MFLLWLRQLMSWIAGRRYGTFVLAWRSRSEIRKFASEGTKQGGGATTRRPSLTLLDPLLMNFRARVSHHHPPCRA